MNKIRRVFVSPLLAIEWLKGHSRPYTTNLPTDAEIVSMHVEPLMFYSSDVIAQQLIVLIMRSEQFSEVKQGDLIPAFTVECKTIE